MHAEQKLQDSPNDQLPNFQARSKVSQATLQWAVKQQGFVPVITTVQLTNFCEVFLVAYSTCHHSIKPQSRTQLDRCGTHAASAELKPVLRPS